VACLRTGDLHRDCLMPTHPPDPSRWFVEHVLPHEEALRGWLHRQFSRQIEVDDIVQDAYARLLQAHADGTVVSPRAFLFHIARNLALNHVRKKGYTHPAGRPQVELSAVLDSSAGVPEMVARAEDIRLLVEAIQSLPKRCRQIFTLRKIYGLSQKEIAAHLGVSEHTVEVQGAIGVRKCVEFFHRRGDARPPS
jgi:RNA polymerase sigma factor (sigma-70 family)